MCGVLKMNNKHYKHYADGEITMYGNSCKIEENTTGLTEKQKWEMYSYRLHKGLKQPKPPTRKSGDIKAFSKKARLRLMKKLFRFDFKSKNDLYFVTLTYPGRYPEERETYKNDLDVFRKRLKRKFGEISYIWRLEAQKRGAPHYHFILYFEDDKPSLEKLKKWVSQNWYQVVQRLWEEKDEKHLRAGTNCKKVNNFRHAIAYVSKYMAKVEQDKLIDQGRYWGASRNWEDKLAKSSLEGEKLIVFRRLIRKYVNKTNRFLAQKISSCANIEVFLPQGFILKAFFWAKHHKDILQEVNIRLPG